jgi:hypothetical protein
MRYDGRPDRGRGRAGWLVVLAVAGGLLAGAAWAAAGTSAGERDREVAYRTGAAGESVPVAGETEAESMRLAGEAAGESIRLPSDPGAVPADRAVRRSMTAQARRDRAAARDPAGTSTDARAGGRATTKAGEPAGALTQQAVRVLRGWDRARAAAYAAGSVRSLRALYDDGAGEADVHLLRSYLRRGYRVEHLRMQLLAVHVLRHRPGLWDLRVTDRLAAAVAVGYGERLDLPRDRASTRTVVLRRDRSGEWRVARVSG